MVSLRVSNLISTLFVAVYPDISFVHRQRLELDGTGEGAHSRRSFVVNKFVNNWRGFLPREGE